MVGGFILAALILFWGINWTGSVDWIYILAALIGALIIGALRFIPFFGSFVSFVAAAFGLGGIIKTQYGTGRPWFKKEAVAAKPA